MPFASAYVMVLYHCILEHRIRFKTVLLWKGVWRCLNGVELKQHEFYAFLYVVIIANHWELRKAQTNGTKDLVHKKRNTHILHHVVGVFLIVLMLPLGRATAQSKIRTDVPLMVYRCSLSGSGKSFDKGQIIDVHFIVENYRKQQSPAIEFCVYVPTGVSILYGDGIHNIDPLVYRTTQGISYKISINSDYNIDSVPIEVWMSDDKGILSPCYQATILIGQTESFATVTPITHSTLKSATTSTISPRETTKPTTTRYRVVNAPKLNVRQMPSTKAKIVGSLSAGDYIEVDSIEKGWAYISHKGQRAFISAKYIELDPMEEIIVEEQPEETIPEPTQAVIAQVPSYTQEITTSNKKIGNLWFVSNLGLGFSNLASPDAYSYGTFGMAAEVGLRYHWGFLPQNMFTDITLGFSLLGNESYRFPYLSITLYPFEIAHTIFNKPFFGQVGLSLLLGGDDIYIYRGSFYRTYYAQPCIALELKESIELNRHWNVGFQYIRGLNNVCDNLPIGLYHESIQVFATYKFSIK